MLCPIKDDPLCTGLTEESHTCPYKVEIDKDEDECYCCEHCEKECAEDI